ncbi:MULTISPECIES: aldehyde dehydrogenase [unclassified Microcystis]|uniref:aldehyde dehydrogenase n=1 Tax=unclassified Microcystis TaxID=2643300 RepID=UPI0022CA04C9|nr:MULTISPECIES: aldehyde dehydrogenase [unclassified Microcystis]MCA2692362.1 aldehyde dehydrogenase [Microcystis sp. M034S2]MCA2749314.1 aldehyde dehydrogenase [Microcystis sp. M144S2]MCZ8199351.1 aldehyde dehydrogenase [Microcystis sp. LE19-55.1A]MCZ8306849.1 aldehyde dehydrogenase [Microcystis sp. LE19-98.1E]
MLSNSEKLAKLRQYFASGATRSYQFRRQQLEKLKQAIIKYEADIYEALYRDLKKSPEDCWITENGFLLVEINTALKNLRSWMQPKPVKTNLLNFPSSSQVIQEPLGVVLIIAAWNYPLQLLLVPLVGAIAAGNCAVLKPSEFASATEKLVVKIIKEIFPEEYVLIVPGDGAEVIPNMLDSFTFDHIFFTGSTRVGKIIYQLAAEKLISVTLELGGKSPCVIEADANISVATRRIAVTKFSNCGQMCIAADYVLVHQSQQENLIRELADTIVNFFGEDARLSADYGKIINEKQFDRLIDFLKDGEIVFGGKTDRENLYIQPTLLTNVSLDAPIMQGEIFGPILPIIAFSTFEEALAIIAKNPNPLAFYLFTTEAHTEKKWLESVQFGGGCINNNSFHFTNPSLPFGGRGNSGIGSYHGRFSFDNFSHQKAIMKTPLWFNPALKYPPFKGKLGLFKLLVR